jgi:hypothetical protein
MRQGSFYLASNEILYSLLSNSLLPFALAQRIIEIVCIHECDFSLYYFESRSKEETSANSGFETEERNGGLADDGDGRRGRADGIYLLLCSLSFPFSVCRTHLLIPPCAIAVSLSLRFPHHRCCRRPSFSSSSSSRSFCIAVRRVSTHFSHPLRRVEMIITCIDDRSLPFLLFDLIYYVDRDIIMLLSDYKEL